MFFTQMWESLKLQKRSTKKRRVQRRRAQLRQRLVLEALEERTLPAVNILNPSTGLNTNASGADAAANTQSSAGPHFMLVNPTGTDSGLSSTASASSGPQSQLPPPPTLSYNGGPLLQNVQVTGVYYGTSGNQSGYKDPSGKSVIPTLDSWFKTVLPSDDLTQFLNSFSAGGQTIGAGTFEGDIFNGATVSEGSTLDDSQIQSMLSSELKGGAISPNANSLYFVFVPQGVEVTAGGSNSVTGFLGYHSAFVDSASGKTIYYAVMPWQGSANDGNTGLDGPNAELGSEIQFFHSQLTSDPLTEVQDLTGVGAHELAEAITDPSVGVTAKLGWLDTTDPQANGGGSEIGDLANAELMTYKGFVMQELWSRKPTDPANEATGPVGVPADTDFYISQVNAPTEGNFNGVLATFTDTSHPNEPVSDFNVAVNWDDGSSNSIGDGSGDISVVSNGNGTFNIVAKHTYSLEAGNDLGTYAFNFDGLKIFVQDTTTGQTAWNKPPEVLQEAPFTNVTGNTFNATLNQALTNQLVATFTDPGSFTPGTVPNDFSATINWGDNTALDSNVSIVADGTDANGNAIYQVFGVSHTYTTSTGSPFTVQVNITDGSQTVTANGQASFLSQGEPTTTTASTPTPTLTFSTSLQHVTLDASVTSSGGTVDEGKVKFTVVNGTGKTVGTAVSTSVASNGTASVSYGLPAFTNVGSYTIKASYTDSKGNFAASNNSTQSPLPALSVTAAGTALTATNASATYSTNAQNVTLTANVTSTGNTVDEGKVKFTVVNGTKTIGAATGTLTANSNGNVSAKLGLPAFTNVGSYTIKASYTDSKGNFAASTNASQSPLPALSVTAASTSITASNATAFYSTSPQHVTLNAKVTSSGGTVDEGKVKLTVVNGAGATIGTAVSTSIASNGTASVSYGLPAFTNVGSYTIKASYTDSKGNFAASTNATQSPLPALTITSGVPTTTTSSSVTTTFSTGSQYVTLTANVSTTAGPVTGGTVTFALMQNNNIIGTATTSANVRNGQVSVSYLLPAGTAAGRYTISAIYNPISGLASSSDVKQQPQPVLTVAPAATTITASNATVHSSHSTQKVTLTAQVQSTAGPVNEGTVTFTILQGSKVIGTATTSLTVHNGVATVSYVLPANLAAGYYTIEAVYNPGGDFRGSADLRHLLTVSRA